ncbi:MAG: helix-turn-helix transcriptional regulator [Polyangia bacterium]
MESTTQSIWRLPTVVARVGLSKSTIYKMIDEGRFPAQVLVGIRAVGWRTADVENWMAQRVTVGRPPKTDT